MDRRQSLETERLTLRRPRAEDASAIFDRYASDPDVTRYIVWPQHQSIEDTLSFIRFSDDEWDKWPVGPLLIFRKDDNSLIGATGLSFQTPEQAMGGYGLAKDSWGKGYATEAYSAVIRLAKESGVRKIISPVHPQNTASQHVLKKLGFEIEDGSIHYVFPNLAEHKGCPIEVKNYALTLTAHAILTHNPGTDLHSIGMHFVHKGAKVKIRPILESDAGDLFQSIQTNRQHLRLWLPWLDQIKTVEDEKGFIIRAKKQAEEQSALVMVVSVDGKVAGTCGFNHFDWGRNIGYIGYWLGKGYEGQGLMTRCAAQVTELGLTKLGLDHIDISCAKDNMKSRRIPSRLGFVELESVEDRETLYGVTQELVSYVKSKANARLKPREARCDFTIRDGFASI